MCAGACARMFSVKRLALSGRWDATKIFVIINYYNSHTDRTLPLPLPSPRAYLSPVSEHGCQEVVEEGEGGGGEEVGVVGVGLHDLQQAVQSAGGLLPHPLLQPPPGQGAGRLQQAQADVAHQGAWQR